MNFRAPDSRARGIGGRDDVQLWPRSVRQCLRYIAAGWLPFDNGFSGRISELPGLPVLDCQVLDSNTPTEAHRAVATERDEHSRVRPSTH